MEEKRKTWVISESRLHDLVCDADTDAKLQISPFLDLRRERPELESLKIEWLGLFLWPHPENASSFMLLLCFSHHSLFMLQRYLLSLTPSWQFLM